MSVSKISSLLVPASTPLGGRQKRHLVTGLLVLCLGLVISPIHAWAQTSSAGTVVGVVSDPSGAVVPNATVTMTDKATSAKRTTMTNQTGAYVFVNVPPGTYDITINQPGFAEARVPNRVVEVGKQLTLNVSLKVGAATQVVEVSVTGTELQTLNSTVGNTVSGTTLQSLPSLGRDVSSFVTMQPGVSPDGSVAGTVVDQSVFMLDGGNNSNDMDGSGGVYNPSFGDDPAGGLFSNINNPITGIVSGIAGNQPSGVMPTPVDSVEEFKVATSNQTADFNNSSGMQVSIVTKRGTSAWHGTVYEYYLDNTMSGNTWENNQPTPGGTVPNTPVPDWHRSWFGGAIGGPIIPKEILGGKTYFFFNYQGARWPNSETFERVVPSDCMRNGVLTLDGGTTYTNLNPSAATCTPVGGTRTTFSGTTLDPRGKGINAYVKQMWNNSMPLPTPGAACPSSFVGFCDNFNTLDFRANLALPQNDNFAVVRIDHDFGPKWHFMSSYRYYHLERATPDQVDIGGVLGGSLGTPKSLTNRPQVPWYLVLGMTTNISSHVTNDFRYSFLRNWWQWGSSGDPVQPFSGPLSGLAAPQAALEPFGEQWREALTPYNVNNQQTRTRFWDGKDHFFSDNVSMLKGSHLLQFGGQYQHNWNYHQRTDNGAGINYYPVYLLGDTKGSGNVTMTGLGAAFSDPSLARDAAAVLGIVTDAQQALTRSGSNLAVNSPLTPATDQSTIPYYNLYFNDTWHIKPALTLTYGLGWTLEMPPVEASGKQVLFVDAKGLPIDTATYLAQRQAAALAGQVFNPEVGFALLPNVTGHPKYPYDPFYGGFGPRVAVAWNPDLGERFGGKNTVFRGGYGRIYGRVNGVNLVLTPLLSPGLIQAVNCVNVLNYTTTPGDGTPSCNAAVTPDVNTAFRIGAPANGGDGTRAPLPAPPVGSPLPQPYFPGTVQGGVLQAIAATASPLDPHFKPNSVDSFDFTIQHQISSKMSVEVGVISRWIHNELQNINLVSVPYMMTKGGQQFQSAYAAVEKALGCATSAGACGANVPKKLLADNVTPNPAYATYFNTTFATQDQAFFKTALAPTGYCAQTYAGVAFANCTAAVAALEGSNFVTQSVWTLWSDLDTGGVTCAPNVPCGFNFPFSMMNTAGQVSSNVTMSTSLGHGNYNAGFVTFKMNNWHGVTMQNNFTWSKALGTGGEVQAVSSETVVDPFNLDTQYGPQAFDRKFVYTMFLVYQPPYYRGQQGLLGHVLGGWTFAPIFTAGSGAPLPCNTNTGGFGEGYSGGQDFGSADASSVWTNGNCVMTSRAGTAAGVHLQPDGTYNMFADPKAVFANVRPLILGLDNRSGGFGQFRGLPYWNMNLGIKKNFRVTERFSADASVNFVNVLNHNQLLDPYLNIAGETGPGFGALSTEGTIPRTMEFGIRVNF